MDDQVKTMLAELKEQELFDLVRSRLDEGADPFTILKACQEGMVAVGERYEQGIYFISDLMMAGEIFKQIGEILGPKLLGESGPTGGKVIVGTVKDDIHDIGKDLVVGMLKSANLDVTDLGVDVPPENFVQALKDTGAKVIGLSALLTVAFDSLKNTVDAITEAGLRDQVKIMIGGGPVDEHVRQFAGADAWGTDAQAAVRQAKEWLK